MQTFLLGAGDSVLLAHQDTDGQLNIVLGLAGKLPSAINTMQRGSSLHLDPDVAAQPLPGEMGGDGGCSGVLPDEHGWGMSEHWYLFCLVGSTLLWDDFPADLIGDLIGDLLKEVQHAQEDLKHHQEEFLLQAVWDAGRTDNAAGIPLCVSLPSIAKNLPSLNTYVDLGSLFPAHPRVQNL